MELEVKFKVDGTCSLNPVEKGYSLVKESHQIDKYVLVNKLINGKRTYFRYREDLLKKTYSCDFHQIVSEYATDEKEISLKNREELQLMVGIHQELGFEICCLVDKRRKTFSKGDLTLVIDNIKDLGIFVEIELIGVDSEENRHVLETEIKRLGLDNGQRIKHKGYPDLILETQT